MAAQYFTGDPKPPQFASAPPPATPYADPDWQETLAAIQKTTATALPPSPDGDAVSNLLQAAQSPNLTDTIARTLLINLSEAKAQGLGGDIPTQDRLVAQAVAQIEQDRGTPQYTQADLVLIEQNQDSLKKYGNDVMATMMLHPQASYENTLLAIGHALENSDAAQLSGLVAIQQEYSALARDLARVPVPLTLAPLHLQVINNVARIASTYADMRMVFDDSLRALAGLQLYESLTDETQRVFINIGQILAGRGILFNEDEPGRAWNVLLLQS